MVTPFGSVSKRVFANSNWKRWLTGRGSHQLGMQCHRMSILHRVDGVQAEATWATDCTTSSTALISASFGTGRSGNNISKNQGDPSVTETQAHSRPIRKRRRPCSLDGVRNFHHRSTTTITISPSQSLPRCRPRIHPHHGQGFPNLASKLFIAIDSNLYHCNIYVLLVLLPNE